MEETTMKIACKENEFRALNKSRETWDEWLELKSLWENKPNLK